MRALRRAYRGALLAEALAEVAANFAVRRVGSARGFRAQARARANWLQDAATTVLRRIGVAVTAEGDPPLHGLVVSNHLSYLDVLVFASLMPCVFLAKEDVRGWPVFGTFATMSGTIFVRRERHAANRGAGALMEELLQAGLPVVLFPEGTSSDGSSVLPFYSQFFEPAVRAKTPVTAAAVGYAGARATEEALAYHSEDVFASHLLRTIGERRVEAFAAFSQTRMRFVDRKKAALRMHEQVSALRASLFGKREGVGTGFQCAG